MCCCWGLLVFYVFHKCAAQYFSSKVFLWIQPPPSASSWSCVCVCVGVLKGSLCDEQVLVGEKFYLFLQQVVPGEAPILKMITSVPITSARLSPRSVGTSKLAARINTLHVGNRGSFNRWALLTHLHPSIFNKFNPQRRRDLNSN
jgi:hypothetical protein